MTDMTDVELNLKVARIMYPEYEWHSLDGMDIVQGTSRTLPKKHFIYSNQGYAFDMAVWLANQDDADVGSYPSLIMAEIIKEENPQHALAMAIKEIGESNGKI